MSLRALFVSISMFALACSSSAQLTQPPTPPAGGDETTFDLSVVDARLSDVMTHVEALSRVDMSPQWRTARIESGLDPDATITLDVRRVSLPELLEQADAPDAWPTDRSTWQRLPNGTIELGPRTVLNRRTRTVIYDIDALVLEAPNFTAAPTLDLQQALQQAQSGAGGGGLPLEEETDDPALPTTPLERAEEIAALVREFVEPEQWTENGGAGATMRLWRGKLVVRAPGYIHRQLQ